MRLRTERAQADASNRDLVAKESAAIDFEEIFQFA
jgi:hypothetical protein